MPNTVVKLPDADDSALEAARENMSLPGLEKTDIFNGCPFFCCLKNSFIDHRCVQGRWEKPQENHRN